MILIEPRHESDNRSIAWGLVNRGSEDKFYFKLEHGVRVAKVWEGGILASLVPDFDALRAEIRRFFQDCGLSHWNGHNYASWELEEKKRWHFAGSTVPENARHLDPDTRIIVLRMIEKY